jgi:hypothetical protein
MKTTKLQEKEKSVKLNKAHKEKQARQYLTFALLKS